MNDNAPITQAQYRELVTLFTKVLEQNPNIPQDALNLFPQNRNIPQGGLNEQQIPNVPQGGSTSTTVNKSKSIDDKKPKKYVKKKGSGTSPNIFYESPNIKIYKYSYFKNHIKNENMKLFLTKATSETKKILFESKVEST